MNFYPFHIGDYISHTSHLSDAEDLAYRRMIDLYYQTEKPFVDVAMIARRVRSTPEIVKMILKEFFCTEDDGWHNKRADQEIAKYRAMQEGGRKGAALRWGKGSDSPPNHSPMQTKNQEPRTKNHIKKHKANPADCLPAKLPAWLDKAALDSFIDHRKKLKAAMTPLAIDRLISELEKLKGQGHDPKAVMDQSILNGWKGVFEVKNGKQAKGMLWNGIDKQDFTKGVNEDGSF